MKSIKIKFVDFWHGFIDNDNYLFNLISKHYNIILVEENPDVIFFSCYGCSYLQYNCIRVFFSGENLRPDFSGCDYALTFDYNSHPAHFRLPLYVFYIDQKDWWKKLMETNTYAEAKLAWEQKSKFCCMVVSNGLAQKRIKFFHKLSRYQKVDSGGRYLNNIGGPVKDKLEYIKDYKFVISFENSSYPGYTTEKILEPLIKNCIPIYWGNPIVGNDFNKKRFLHLDDFDSEESLINYMQDIENDPEKAIKMLMEPILNDNKLSEYIDEKNVMSFFDLIFSKVHTQIPVARKYYRYIHYVNRKKRSVINHFNRLMHKNFR